MGIFGTKNPYAYAKGVPQTVKDKIASGELKTPGSIKAAIVAAKTGAQAFSPNIVAPAEPTTVAPTVGTGFISPNAQTIGETVDSAPHASADAGRMKERIVRAKTPPPLGAEPVASSLLSSGDGIALADEGGGVPWLLIGAAIIGAVLLAR